MQTPHQSAKVFAFFLTKVAFQQNAELFIISLSSGFSYVDLVEGVKDGRFYALKRILCHDREGRQEAQTEVEMHQMFNHPNILSLVAHTFGDRNGKSEAWLLLPYIRVSCFFI